MTCAEAVVHSLVEHGVDHVFGIPGTHNLPLYDALAAAPIRHVTPRHEQGAGYAADGYARASGRPGVCLTTTGPGLTNIATAAATAYHDSVPLLLLSPGMPSDVDGRDTGYLHELKDQTGALDCLLAWSRRVGSVEEAVGAIRDAFEHFAGERPRPVHVELPIDLLSGDARVTAVPRAKPGRHPVPDVTAAAALLAGARRPLLLLGGGAIDAGQAAVRLAERLDAPVLTTVNAKGVVPESHPLALGAALRLAVARAALADADVLLAVGTELSESDLWVPDFVPRGQVVRVDIDARQLHKNAPATVALLGDAAATLEALAASIDAPRERDGLRRAAALRAELEIEGLVDGEPYIELHRGLRAALPLDAIVTGDSAMAFYFGTIHQLRMEHARQFLYPVGYATLGYALPAAIGAQLAAPESNVVAICGDGGLMFTIGELMAAVELGLPIALVVVNNRGYGEIKAEMLARGSAPIGVDLAVPDLLRLAEAFGAHAVRVEDPAKVGEQVAAAFCRDAPTLIEWVQ
jgi:thiamine pyrophosphate-dependent acetolactate synthase large subunit-like protein